MIFVILYQRGVDREFYVMMMVWSELDSWYINQSIALAMKNGKMVDQENDAFRDVNSMRGISSVIFSNIMNVIEITFIKRDRNITLFSPSPV